jgi:hypothetical protein
MLYDSFSLIIRRIRTILRPKGDAALQKLSEPLEKLMEAMGRSRDRGG